MAQVREADATCTTDRPAEIPAKARKIYDANLERRPVDFVIVGNSSQCLIRLPDSCMIVKPGFMAGATGGGRFAEYHYTDVTGIELNTGFVNAVMAITTPAAQGNSKDFFSSGKYRSHFEASNCLPGAKALFLNSENAAKIKELRLRISAAKTVAPGADKPQVAPTAADLVDQLRGLAELRDDSILTPKEFDEAKQKILGALQNRPRDPQGSQSRPGAGVRADSCKPDFLHEHEQLPTVARCPNWLHSSRDLTVHLVTGPGLPPGPCARASYFRPSCR